MLFYRTPARVCAVKSKELQNSISIYRSIIFKAPRNGRVKLPRRSEGLINYGDWSPPRSLSLSLSLIYPVALQAHVSALKSLEMSAPYCKNSPGTQVRGDTGRCVAKLTITPGLKRSAAFLSTLLSTDARVLHRHTRVHVYTDACTYVAQHIVPPHFVQLFQWLSRLLAEHTSRNGDGILWSTYMNTRAQSAKRVSISTHVFARARARAPYVSRIT